jgi:tRNA-2-methylthio-N6-dimethylallyladenosine synthase
VGHRDAERGNAGFGREDAANQMSVSSHSGKSGAVRFAHQHPTFRSQNGFLDSPASGPLGDYAQLDSATRFRYPCVLMRLETYKIITYGCQMNASDSEMMAGILEARGLRPAKSESNADVLLVNTCIVRGSAEQRAQGRIARLKELKSGRQDCIIGVCGCMAQRDAEMIFDQFPHVDLVLGTRAIPNLSAMLDHALDGQTRVACVDEVLETTGRLTSSPVDQLLSQPVGRSASLPVGQLDESGEADRSDQSDGPAKSIAAETPSSSIRNPKSTIRNSQSSVLNPQHSVVPVRRSALRALVPIMMGCNNWCSYCIVPTVRGREQSRAVGVILDEVKALVQCGCREVTLVGQNVNSYRDGEVDFAELLERVDAVEGLSRIRYITSHPRDANDRHLDAVAGLEKVCDHFHLPAQSGSTPVLARMNRGYTREDYLDLIRRVRERVPDATITTDLIVGFPGETDADYEQTLDLVKEVRFDSAFTFLYNVREGTKAAEWEDDVPLKDKKERLARLIEIQERISFEKNQALEGTTLEVLVEGPARRSGEGTGNVKQYVGRTTGDKCVVFEGSRSDAGRLIRTRIVEGAAHTLFGEKTVPSAED